MSVRERHCAGQHEDISVIIFVIKMIPEALQIALMLSDYFAKQSQK